MPTRLFDESTLRVVVSIVRSPLITADPEISTFADGERSPMPTFPEASIMNGVESGFVESSTRSAAPVPFA